MKMASIEKFKEHSSELTNTTDEELNEHLNAIKDLLSNNDKSQGREQNFLPIKGDHSERFLKRKFQEQGKEKQSNRN